MGDWYVDNRGRWAYDENAPSPSPSPTQMMPVVPAAQTVDVPPRVDDWCEDRAPHELSDDDEAE